MASSELATTPTSSMGDSIGRVARAILPPLLAIAAALATGALILAITGFDPLRAYAAMWEGIVGSRRNVGEALLRSTPLILIGTGIAIAFRCGIWNIGAEGQFYMGAAAGTFVGLHAGAFPVWISVPLAFAAGMVAGGLWAAIAGWLKVRMQLNEVVTTIMLNYIALGLVSWLVTGPMQEASGYNPQTDEIAASMELARIFPPTRLHAGFLVAVVVAVLAGILLFRTHWGYKLRAVGANPVAARHAGINVGRQLVLAMFLSGACAGLAGTVEILGVVGRLYETIGAGYGFTGIAVSLLVGNNPFGVIGSGILFGALSTGSELMQLTAGIPSVMTFILQGLIIAFLVSFQAIARRMRPA
jgi:simple sugar transport system permease protein